jgi:hypothetical protein
MYPMKSTASRAVAAAVVAGACCMFAAAPAQASARPEWSPYRTAPFALPTTLTVMADGSRVLVPGRTRVENICTTLATTH